MKRKLISVILAAALLTGLLSACGSGEKQPETVTLSAHAEGSIFGGSGGDGIPVRVTFQPRWLTKADNTVYSGELAAFAALLSADTYFREKDLAKGTQNRVLIDGTDADAYTFTTLLTALGFSGAEHIESYSAKTYDDDPNDSVTMNLGYMNADGCDVFVAAIRGCFSAGEWTSIFDTGADTARYESVTGEHPEWTHRSAFKGVDIAANRAYEFLQDFIAKHDDPARQNRVLVTGHSRGGAIAELLGARLEAEQGVTAYTYAFNSAAVTSDASAQSCASVFNLFDSGDFFTEVLPFGEETLYRFGRTLTADVGSDGALRGAIAELKGRDDYRSGGPELIREYRELFGARFPSRAALYEPRSRTETFPEEDAAEARREELETIIGSEAGFGLEALCALSGVERTEDGQYALTLDYCDAAVLFSLGKILTYGAAVGDAVLSAFGDEPGTRAIAGFYLEHAAGNHPVLREVRP